MDFKKGIDRNQISFTCIDMLVDQNSWARHIDVFVECLPLGQLGFRTTISSEGRPPYDPSDLLKLYLYGYRHGIRSSRKLEHCCIVNIEMMWLLKGLRPCNRTIAYFRKKNSLAIKNTFRYFVLLLKELGYVEGKVIALDSVKIRAQNSLKNNFNIKKIKRHKDYINDKIEDYLHQLDQTDSQEEKEKIENKIAERNVKKAKYEQIERQLERSGEAQISLIDEDAKAVILHRNIVNVGYNVQMVSDEKNKMLIHADTGSVNDTHALASMTMQVKEDLSVEQLTVLADKGYTTGAELALCAKNGITTFCSPKGSTSNHNGLFNIEEFVYNKEEDIYQCPAGQQLRTNGSLYKKGATYRMKRYGTKKCKTCPIKSECTRNVKGRFIERHEFQDAIDENRKRVDSNKDYYRKRQQIIEHQFGTMKRQWHFDHTLMRGKENVLAEVFLISICYNLRRLMSLLNAKDFLEAIKRYKSLNLVQIRDVSHNKSSQKTQLVSNTRFCTAVHRIAC